VPNCHDYEPLRDRMRANAEHEGYQKRLNLKEKARTIRNAA
jgi:hypothetical protein